MKLLRYIEACTEGDHRGPAWIARVEASRSGRTVYFDGRALQASSGGGGPGNHYDLETGEPYWVSGVKRSGSNRHWAGAGVILVEASAVDQLLTITGAGALDESRYRVIPDLRAANPRAFVERFNEPL